MFTTVALGIQRSNQSRCIRLPGEASTGEELEESSNELGIAIVTENKEGDDHRVSTVTSPSNCLSPSHICVVEVPEGDNDDTIEDQ